MASNLKRRYSVKEYFEVEKNSSIKHEFVYGEIFAMTGASEKHNSIAFNISGVLAPQLRRTNCKGYVADMRTIINEQLYRYPDIVVACSPRLEIFDGLETLMNPTLVIEILSRSTARYDRDGKFREYQQNNSIQYYLLIAQYEMSVILFTKQDNDIWSSLTYSNLNDVVSLPLINCELALADIYWGVEF